MTKIGRTSLIVLILGVIAVISLAVYFVLPTLTATSDDKPEVDSTLTRIAYLPTLESLPLFNVDTTEVKLLEFEAAMDADTAFLRGHADAIMTDLVKATTWHEADSNVVVLFCYRLPLQMLGSRQARLLNAQRLKDRIIGLTRHSSLDFFADQMLNGAKLKKDDLNRPQINNIRIRTSMLRQNQYDGAVLPQPYANQALANGATIIRPATTDSVLANIGAFVIRKDLPKQKMQTLLALQETYEAAAQQLAKHFAAEHFEALRRFDAQLEYADSIYRGITAPRIVDCDSALLARINAWCISRHLTKRAVSTSEIRYHQP